MKKILLATSILAATTGFAAAEVAVSGSARMGVYFDGNDAYFTSRVRVAFAMSGESDSGLSFGASIRADQSGIGNGGDGTGLATVPGDDMSAGSVYVSGAFGKLTFGDNDSAANALVGNVSGVGMTGLDDMNELGYLGQTDTSALYQYDAGALSVALSSSQLQAADKAFSVAVKYSTDAFTVALGYEDTAADQQISLGASGTFSGATVKLVAADRDSWASTHFALSADYAINATTITAYYADHDATSAYGLGVSHDLGGGLSMVGGIAKAKGADAIADFGLSMSF